MELSVIIVSYNTREILQRCLESVIKHTKDIKHEILVIDNASTDDTAKFLKKLKETNKNVKVILNESNLGFGQANNKAAKAAKGENVLFLNSDTLVHDNVLKEISTWMRKHPKAGVVTCSLMNKDGSLQGTGGYFPTLLRVFAWMHFLDDLPILDKLIKPFHPMHANSPFYKGENYFKNAHQRDWVTGAFFLTRKSAFNKAGGFDKDYFMYTEEVDLCYRIKKLGYQIWFLPQWNITHLGGVSSTKEFPIISEFKGVKTFYKKHMPPWQLPLLRLFLKSGAVFRMLLFGITKGRESLKTYAKAFKIA